jgi:hypothetical protein
MTNRRKDTFRIDCEDTPNDFTSCFDIEDSRMSKVSLILVLQVFMQVGFGSVNRVCSCWIVWIRTFNQLRMVKFTILEQLRYFIVMLLDVSKIFCILKINKFKCS